MLLGCLGYKFRIYLSHDDLPFIWIHGPLSPLTLKTTRSPSSALHPSLGKGSPTKIDYRKKKEEVGTLIPASLLEDLGICVIFSVGVKGNLCLKPLPFTFFNQHIPFTLKTGIFHRIPWLLAAQPWPGAAFAQRPGWLRPLADVTAARCMLMLDATGRLKKDGHCIFTCVFVAIYIYVYHRCLYMCVYACLVCKYVHACMHACMHSCMHTDGRTDRQTYIHIIHAVHITCIYITHSYALHSGQC